MANGTDVQMAELRSEEVQEVMGQIPSWIVRWGIGVLFLALLILLVGCYFLTSSMRHPKQKFHLGGSKSDLIARCFSVRKSVFVK